MAESTLEIRIGEVEVRLSGEEAGLPEQLDAVLSTLRRHLPERLLGEPDPTAVEPPSAAELLARSNAQTFGDKAGVIAYWLQRHGGRARWRSGEIVEVLKEAGEATPTNITDALNYKVRKGLFEVKDRMWELTERGVGWVEYGLGVESRA